jgi:23S rRNA (guanosine2251-2'-O)-methyltransferase
LAVESRMKEWITGRNPVFETLRAKHRDVFRLWIAAGAEEKGRLTEIIRLAASRKVKAERVHRQQLDALSENPQGVALEVSSYPYSDLPQILDFSHQKGEKPFILILDTIQNPQNLGTLLRTAEAFGVHGVLLPLARAAGITPAVVTASAGACEHLRVAQVNLAQVIARLKKEGLWVIGLEGSEQSQPIEQARLDGALALVVGSEGEGLRELTRKSCDLLVKLPMAGQIESLNAAVAGSVALYLAYRTRSG